MSEVIETNTSEEVVDIVPLENEVTTNNTEEVKEEFKPWKEKKNPETIPYGRFSEVNAQKKAAEERTQELERELASIRNISEKTKAIESIDDLDINDFTDIKEYQKALITVAQKEFEKEQTKKEETRRIQEIEQNITKEFTLKLEKAVAKNPEVKDAADYIGQFAAHIPAQTRYALLTEDNPGEVMYEIATTPGLLEQISRMNPLDAARKIAKISSKYDNVSESKVLDIPKVMPTTRTGTPNIKANVASGKIQYSDNMSMKEYKAWAKQENIRI